MRKYRIKRFLQASSIASIVVGIGLEVSGIEIPMLGYILIGLGGAYWLFEIYRLLICPKLTLFKRQRQKTIGEAEVFEIEVPEDKLHKVIGTPPPEGRTLDIKGKWVKRKIKQDGRTTKSK